MARVKPRSNVYALMPILACLIMGFGIWLTWDQGVRLYREDPEIDAQPKVIKKLVLPDATPEPEGDVTEEITEGEGTEEDEGATEGAPTDDDGTAPGEADGAAPPADGGEAAPE